MVLAGVTGALACASGWVDHGDTYFAEKTKSAAPEQATYKFTPPGADWEPIDQKGAQVVWASRSYPAVIHLDSQCGKHGDSSLEQFTDHLMIDFREWKKVSQQIESFSGRDAVRTVVIGELDGVQQMQMELLVLKKDGCLFDFQLLAPPSYFAQGKVDFDRVVSGFTFPIR